jgi:hypothetical protein
MNKKFIVRCRSCQQLLKPGAQHVCSFAGAPSFVVPTRISNRTYQHNDDENFSLSYVVADITGSYLMGYLVGRSVLGSLVGSFFHRDNNTHSTTILEDRLSGTQTVPSESYDAKAIEMYRSLGVDTGIEVDPGKLTPIFLNEIDSPAPVSVPVTHQDDPTSSWRTGLSEAVDETSTRDSSVREYSQPVAEEAYHFSSSDYGSSSGSDSSGGGGSLD